MHTTSFDRIVKEKFHELSVAQKKVVEYLLNNLEKAAFSTALQIGRDVDVSETTVIRSSHALGFASFSEMQARIQQQFMTKTMPANTATMSSDTGEVEKENPFAKVIVNDIGLLQNLLSQLNLEEIWRAVEAIVSADQVMVVGNRASYSTAHWLAFVLGTLRNHVYLCPAGGDTYEKLFNLNRQSVVVAISFPRYSRETLNLAENAKKQGVTLISITDRVLSPIGRISDIPLLTNFTLDIDTGLASLASANSIIHAIVKGVILKDQDGLRDRQQKLEQFYNQHNIFVE